MNANMLLSDDATLVVVPWHNPEQAAKFITAWRIKFDDPRVLFQQDKTRAGCALTKNAGIRAAIARGAEVVIVLDDDCFPTPEMNDADPLADLIAGHLAALKPQPVDMFEVVTNPPSRGTPYHSRTITMPVAASMGFWTHVGDYDACGQLVQGATRPMTFHRKAIHGRYFPLCGMNLAFRPRLWDPWWQFINVSRFDDIWQGWLWQKCAYANGHCFNLAGPIVHHSRQSNVWANLRDEALHLEANDTLWQKIATAQTWDYNELIELLPIPPKVALGAA
jgi:hypothetical protein